MSTLVLPWTTRALETLDRFMPGAREGLASQPFEALESEGNPGIGIFKDSGGPAALIPDDFGGGGASAREAVEIQYAIGSLAPSTAVGVTMHQFTVATLVEVLREEQGLESLIIEAVASQGLLVASAFAEGRPDGNVLDPTMTLSPDGPGYRLRGVKKPCSLAHSMDMITVSVKLPDPSDQFAVALIGATDDGLRVEPFWESPVLAGAETAAVMFDDVAVPQAALSYIAASSELDRTQIRGYVWFQLCIAASYLGIAARLVQQLPQQRADDAATGAMAGEICSGLAMLASVAARLDAGESGRDLLADALVVRYAVERAIQRSTDLAIELLGVEQVSRRPELALTLTASRALSYHPPSRRRTQSGIANWVRGGELVVQ